MEKVWIEEGWRSCTVTILEVKLSKVIISFEIITIRAGAATGNPGWGSPDRRMALVNGESRRPVRGTRGVLSKVATS